MRVHLSSALAIAGTLALAAAPALAHPTTHAVVAARVTSDPSAWSGVYRVQFALAGKSTAPAALVVERTSDGASAFVLVDEKGLPLGNVRIDGDTLRARLTTEHGTGDLVLRVNGDDVTGTFTVGKQKWDVAGTKTA